MVIIIKVEIIIIMIKFDVDFRGGRNEIFKQKFFFHVTKSDEKSSFSSSTNDDERVNLSFFLFFYSFPPFTTLPFPHHITSPPIFR